MTDIADRQKDYEKAYDLQIIKRIPVMCRVDGRGFSRLCRKLKKPYEPLLLEAMVATMFYVASEADNCVFAYTQSDEISFVFRNDQSLDSEPWYGNRIQKMASIMSGLATLGFNRAIQNLEYPINLSGDAIFDARVWGLPSISETLNNLIWRQLDCMRNAVSQTSQTLLGRKYGKKTALKMLHGVGTKDKIELLEKECSIKFEQEYPTSYRLGVAAYKIPLLVSGKDGEQTTRKKWTIDWEIPNFIVDREFIYNIVATGHDIFRLENSHVNSESKM